MFEEALRIKTMEMYKQEKYTIMKKIEMRKAGIDSDALSQDISDEHI